MATQEKLRNYLVGKIRLGEISKFTELFTAFVFGGGSSISSSELLGYFEYLLKMAVEAHRDDLALALLNKIRDSYSVIEQQAEMVKKEGSDRALYHFGNAAKRADDKFFEFIVREYPSIDSGRKSNLVEYLAPVMQKTRFQMLEYASQRWTQEMTDESYFAFHFLIDALNPPEKKEMLDKIFRPRVENWFKNIGLIEGWIMDCKREPIPYEVQQLLVMARAENGGPELAKRDIANSIALKSKKI